VSTQQRLPMFSFILHLVWNLLRLSTLCSRALHPRPWAPPSIQRCYTLDPGLHPQFRRSRALHPRPRAPPSIQRCYTLDPGLHPQFRCSRALHPRPRAPPSIQRCYTLDPGLHPQFRRSRALHPRPQAPPSIQRCYTLDLGLHPQFRGSTLHVKTCPNFCSVYRWPLSGARKNSAIIVQEGILELSVK
jgi:hypothetical protein